VYRHHKTGGGDDGGRGQKREYSWKIETIRHAASPPFTVAVHQRFSGDCVVVASVGDGVGRPCARSS